MGASCSSLKGLASRRTSHRPSWSAYLQIRKRQYLSVAPFICAGGLIFHSMDFLNYLKPEKVERVVSILKLRMPDWDTLSTEEKDHAKNLLTLDMIADVAFTTAIETELHSLRDLTVANEMFSAQDAANFREYEGQVDSGMLDRDAQTNLMVCSNLSSSITVVVADDSPCRQTQAPHRTSSSGSKMRSTS